MSKYRNRKVKVNGVTYDSMKEAQRHIVLKQQEKCGKIRNLKRQVKYVLIPAQRDPKTGKVIERACTYIADFTYQIADTGKLVVEDVKGYKTPEYKIKKKLMLYIHKIRIKET